MSFSPFVRLTFNQKEKMSSRQAAIKGAKPMSHAHKFASLHHFVLFTKQTAPWPHKSWL